MGFQTVAQDRRESHKAPEWKLQTSESKSHTQAKFTERFVEAHKTLSEPVLSPKLDRGKFQMNLRRIMVSGGNQRKLSFSCVAV